MALIKKYTGDTFRNLIRQYSFDRMAYDPQYRRAVRKAKAEKKAARAAKVSNEKASSPSSSTSGGVSRQATNETQAS
jgi:hypothetical protein